MTIHSRIFLLNFCRTYLPVRVWYPNQHPPGLIDGVTCPDQVLIKTYNYGNNYSSGKKKEFKG